MCLKVLAGSLLTGGVPKWLVVQPLLIGIKVSPDVLH
jgi:hypothetical protein